MQSLIKIIKNDINFLYELKLIDYSLLIIIVDKEMLFKKVIIIKKKQKDEYMEYMDNLSKKKYTF